MQLICLQAITCFTDLSLSDVQSDINVEHISSADTALESLMCDTSFEPLKFKNLLSSKQNVGHRRSPDINKTRSENFVPTDIEISTNYESPSENLSLANDSRSIETTDKRKFENSWSGVKKFCKYVKEHRPPLKSIDLSNFTTEKKTITSSVEGICHFSLIYNLKGTCGILHNTENQMF